MTSAVTMTSQMLHSFKSVRFGLIVGIGRGMWTIENDIRLGDVVVSQPEDRFGGMVQYDHGRRTLGGKFEQTGSLVKPPSILLNALSAIRAVLKYRILNLEDFSMKLFRKHLRCKQNTADLMEETTCIVPITNMMATMRIVPDVTRKDNFTGLLKSHQGNLRSITEPSPLE